MLVGNKNDKDSQREVSIEEGQKLSEQLGCGFFEVSAKEIVQVEKTFRQMIHMFRAPPFVEGPSTGTNAPATSFVEGPSTGTNAPATSMVKWTNTEWILFILQIWYFLWTKLPLGRHRQEPSIVSPV
jgi:Ras family